MEEFMKDKVLEPAVLHKFIYELRYDYGYSYLDRCGATINDILKTNPGWFVDNINHQSGRMSLDGKQVIFNFNSDKLDLSQQQSEKIQRLLDIEEFSEIANKMTNKVVDRLGLEQFSRIGFRVLRLFRMDSPEESKAKVKSLNILSIGNVEKLIDCKVEEVSFSSTIKSTNGNARISVSNLEQNIKIDPATLKALNISSKEVSSLDSKERKPALIRQLKLKKALEYCPLYSILVDIDIFIEEPPYSELKIKEFILNSFKWSDSLSNKIIKGG